MRSNGIAFICESFVTDAAGRGFLGRSITRQSISGSAPFRYTKMTQYRCDGSDMIQLLMAFLYIVAGRPFNNRKVQCGDGAFTNCNFVSNHIAMSGSLSRESLVTGFHWSRVVGVQHYDAVDFRKGLELERVLRTEPDLVH
jgi:hypothetical protein